MKQACEKFLKLMIVEMEDLEGQIDQLITETLTRGRNNEIAEHVCLGNVAVLQQEKHALRHFSRVVTRLQASDHEDVSELAAALKAVFRKEMKQFDLSKAACDVAEHKMQRVEDYITNTHWSEEKKEYLAAVSSPAGS